MSHKDLNVTGKDGLKGQLVVSDPLNDAKTFGVGGSDCYGRLYSGMRLIIANFKVVPPVLKQ